MVYSYSVITREANAVTRWLHDRVPAILPDAESVHRWLDDDVGAEEAVKGLKPIKKGQVRPLQYIMRARGAIVLRQGYILNLS